MANGTFSRRQVLAGGIGGAATLGLAALGNVGTSGADTVRRATRVKAAGSDLGAVDHVVYLMMENRSFDHFFGTMKGVRGFNDHPAGNNGVFAQAWPNSPGGKYPTLLPFHLDTANSEAECTYDLTHNWAPQHLSWNGGAMDSFVSTHTSASYEGPSHGIDTMGYYKKADIPFMYSLADKFTICDGYHCSALGPTHPNRLMSMSGTLDPAGAAGGPVLVTNSDAAKKFTCSWTTMPEVLDAANVSWRTYNPYGSNYDITSGSSMLLNDNVLQYFSQYQSPTSSLHQNAFGYYGPNVAGGLGSPLGEWYIQQVLNTLLSNPAVWAKTVLFISWDENDGFFDHVSPPTPSPGTNGEYLTVNPLPADANGVAGPIGLGVRVAMLVVSPFSVGGWVCSDTFDHTSQLRFLETRFGVTVPNLSTWRRSVTGDLTAALPAIGAPITKPQRLPLTSASTTMPPISTECSGGQLIEVDNSNQPQYPLKKHQKMPVQQRGSLQRTPG
jgi:phospholipase C